MFHADRNVTSNVFNQGIELVGGMFELAHANALHGLIMGFLSIYPGLATLKVCFSFHLNLIVFFYC